MQYADFAPKLISRTPVSGIRVWPTWDLSPWRRWGALQSRLTLIGEAVHPVAPYVRLQHSPEMSTNIRLVLRRIMGQNASLGLESAVVLAKSFDTFRAEASDNENPKGQASAVSHTEGSLFVYVMTPDRGPPCVCFF